MMNDIFDQWVESLSPLDLLLLPTLDPTKKEKMAVAC